jgi:hypothetical protein
MDCLHCGDCCLRMSPLDAPEPCRFLVVDGTYYFCAQYDKRPAECASHDFPSRFCPIGLEKLNLTTPDQARQRIDEGWEKTRSMS